MSWNTTPHPLPLRIHEHTSFGISNKVIEHMTTKKDWKSDVVRCKYITSAKLATDYK
jgi:hypothetical protein